MKENLGRRTLLSLTIRSYFIRLFYNYFNLFGEGLCVCLVPFTNEDKDNFLKQNLKFFNTNEYLSGFSLGIILRSRDEKPENLEKAKDILSSVAGSVGDRLLYKLILPVIVLTSLNLFAVSGFVLTKEAVNIVLSEIVIFNIFSFMLRYYGIKNGYEKGLESIRIFRTAAYLKAVSVFTYVRNILILILIVNLFILLFN
jgi:mannose/fructose/N-acetylgalactosamine-specific phosphotransferase system component IID